MSDTPRTDIAIHHTRTMPNAWGFKEHDRKEEFVEAGLARQLERELAAMTKRAEELDAELQDVRSLAFNLTEPRTVDDATDDACEQVQLLYNRLKLAAEEAELTIIKQEKYCDELQASLSATVKAKDEAERDAEGARNIAKILSIKKGRHQGNAARLIQFWVDDSDPISFGPAIDATRGKNG